MTDNYSDYRPIRAYMFRFVYVLMQAYKPTIKLLLEH